MKTKLLLLTLVLLSSVMAWAQDFVQDGVNYYIPTHGVKFLKIRY